MWPCNASIYIYDVYLRLFRLWIHGCDTPWKIHEVLWWDSWILSFWPCSKKTHYSPGGVPLLQYFLPDWETMQLWDSWEARRLMICRTIPCCVCSHPLPTSDSVKRYLFKASGTSNGKVFICHWFTEEVCVCTESLIRRCWQPIIVCCLQPWYASQPCCCWG